MAATDDEWVQAQPGDEWDELAKQCPDACAFHSSEWKAALTAAFPQYVASDSRHVRDGRSICLWSSFDFRPAPGIRIAEAGPWNLYGGYLAQSPSQSEFASALNRWEDRSRRASAAFLRLTLHPTDYEDRLAIARQAGFADFDSKRTHWLSLPDDPDTLWHDAYRGSVRTDIRRARKSGVTVEASSCPDDVRAFYALYADSMRRFGSLAKPLVLVEMLLAGSLGRLWVARREGSVVAGLLELRFGRWMTIWMAASEPSERRYSPNHLLYDAALRDATQAGVEMADFGASPPGNDGLVAFKESFGAQEMAFGTVTKTTAPLRSWLWRVAEPAARGAYRRFQRINRPSPTAD